MSSSSPLLKDVRVVGGVALAIGLFAGLSLTSTFASTPAPAADKGSHTGKAESPQKTKKEGAQTGGWRTRRGSLPFPGELKTIPLEARQVQDLRAAKVRRDPPEEPTEGSLQQDIEGTVCTSLCSVPVCICD